MDINKHFNFYEHVIESLKLLGGSGTNSEILEKVISLAKLSTIEVDALHNGGPRTVVDYQVGWAKTYLKSYGYLDSSKRGIWFLTDKAKEPIAKAEEITNSYRLKQKVKKESESQNNYSRNLLNEEKDEWKEDLITKLKSLSPRGFERFCQRILREKGFSKVKITGKSGDQGIDGKGILKINLISFRIIFQCKKYDGGVSPSEIRDFRGAISGNADRGIFLTTGHFRRAAIEEAERSGTNIIELIDGEEICNLLRELNIGIKTTEKISIDNEFFEEFKV